MKKFLLLGFTCLYIPLLHATTYNVQVSNYQFNPSTVNASIGDTIQWTWVNGSHTTTSTSVPGGADTWSAPINATNTTYSYVLTAEGTYNYWCIPHQPEMAGTIEVSGVMPVTLSSFNIMAAGKGASVQWRTINEVNVDHYTIKRSNDGTNFKDIGQVPAINSSEMHTYRFTDNTFAPGDQYLYYYIEVVDKDGAHTSSAIQSFKNAFAKTGWLRQITPNPVTGTDHLMLQFYADKPGKMFAQLYNATGALVKGAQMAAVAGINNGHLHTGALAAGTYVLQCTLDGKKETRRIVVP